MWSCLKKCKDSEPDIFTNRKALLIGINYIGSEAELRGCINDAVNMENLLKESGYSETTVLTELGSDKPTRINIIKYIKEFVKSAKDGDTLFFHFSGHGSRSHDYDGDETDDYDETIVPLDYLENGFITDDELKKILVDPLPNVKMTIVLDCCHSGTGTDLCHKYVYENGACLSETISETDMENRSQVTMISGCRDEQTSADAYIESTFQGALTNTFIDTIRNGNWSYGELLEQLNESLDNRGYTQKPVITTLHEINLDDSFTFV